MFNRLPGFLKNFYFVIGALFLIFMLFISDSNLIRQYQLTKKLKKLESEKAYYTVKIKQMEKDRAELMSDEVLLEKFAREKYLMKKEEEDIYVIVEE
ncbi:septum formation initiator family protein [Fulvivirgaceae bacterium BMA12]|uniref:Septum formation initiator family protein n=1 Tax=Agaribacillus aureus TaxID=3051825 RepID=A0ABT8L4Z1_9BACT|nr:septum formation initiator family protein [Fulvivirgaceae bacterium BMA12]